MEKWLKWAIEIQSLAQAGLTYTDNVYDIERYERLREIAAEIIEEKSNISLEKVKMFLFHYADYLYPQKFLQHNYYLHLQILQPVHLRYK